MALQVNIDGVGVSQRLQESVTTDITLDRFDTGKLLIVSGTAALTCSLPSASAVESGFFATVLCASAHSHSVKRVADTADVVVGNAGQGSSSATGPAPLVLATNFGVEASGSLGASQLGARLEVYCDGTLWYLEGLGTDRWSAL